MRERESRARDAAEIAGICIARLRDKYQLTSLILGGSAAQDLERALDADLCAVVQEDVMGRARLTFPSITVDLFVCGAERIRTDFKRGGLHQHLVTLFATGSHIHGERSVSDSLQSIARDLLRRPAPAPSALSTFAHRSRPFNLLRKFYDVRSDDPATAGLIVAELVHSSVEAYFALNRIWTIGVRQRMKVIAYRNASGAEALRRVTETPLSILREQPAILCDMVTKLVGADVGDTDVWFTCTN